MCVHGNAVCTRRHAHHDFFFSDAQDFCKCRARPIAENGVGRSNAFPIADMEHVCSIHIATPRAIPAATPYNASLNVKRHHFYLAQPHWYMTCFPFLPFTCLAGASSVGVAGPVLPLPLHAFTGVLLLLCLITPAPE